LETLLSDFEVYHNTGNASHAGDEDLQGERPFFAMNPDLPIFWAGLIKKQAISWSDPNKKPLFPMDVIRHDFCYTL
jgi:hypothetical protein